jgi:hypothetical protein
MKKIRVLTDHVLVLNKMTVSRGQEIEVWNDDVLNSDEVKRAMETKQIEIIDERDKPVA